MNPLPVQGNIPVDMHLRLLVTASDFQASTDESKPSAPGHPKPIEITFRRWLDFSETEPLGASRDFTLQDYEPFVLTESLLKGCVYYTNLDGEIHKIPGRISWSELALRRWRSGGGQIVFSVYRNQAPFWHRVVRATVCAFTLFLSVFLYKVAYSY